MMHQVGMRPESKASHASSTWDTKASHASSTWDTSSVHKGLITGHAVALDRMAGRCSYGDSFASRRSVPVTRWSTDVDQPRYSGAQQDDSLLTLCKCGMDGK